MATSRSRFIVWLFLGSLPFLFCCVGVVGVGSWIAYRFGPKLFDDTESRPTLRITAHYDIATAQRVEDSIVLPLEAQLQGMENLESIASISGDSKATLILYLRHGTDLETARVAARNRIAQAESILPSLVVRNGITMTSGGPLPALWLLVTTPDGSRDELFLRNVAQTKLMPELTGLTGVETVTVGWGNDKDLRYRLDPRKLAAHNLSAKAVEKALPPHPFNFRVAVREVDHFLDAVVGADKDGRPVRLKDVAEIGRIGPETVEFARWQGTSAVTIAVEGRQPAALVSAVEQHLPSLRQRLPAGTELHLLPGPCAPAAQGLIVEGQLPVAASSQRVRVILQELTADLAKLTDARAANLIPAELTLPSEDLASLRLYVALCPSSERALTNAEIEAQVHALLARHAEVATRVILPAILARPPLRRSPVVVAVRGPDLQDATHLADTIRDRLTHCESLANVWPEYPRFVPQTRINLDLAKIRQFGLAGRDVMAQLPFPSLSPQDWEQNKDLKLGRDNGEPVPLHELVKVRNITFPRYLQRLDGERRLLITAHPAAGVSVEQARSRSLEIAQQAMRDMNFVADYQVECTGAE